MNFKLLTDDQKKWLRNRKIKENNVYIFPRIGFYLYTKPSYLHSERIDTKPFLESLVYETFLAKKKENGFVKGNFYRRPNENDFYLDEKELSTRDFIEVFFLYMFTTIPMVLYNLVTNIKYYEKRYRRYRRRYVR